MAKIIKIETEQISQILKENDPEKLHKRATEAIEELITEAEILEGEDPSILAQVFAFASFLEARATYLNTKKRIRPNVGPL